MNSLGLADVEADPPRSRAGQRGGYTAAALVLETCVRLQIADPMAFFALPESAQMLQLTHTANGLGGAYRGRDRPRQSGNEAAEVWRSALARAGAA